MNRIIIALALGTTVTLASPVLAGPNGSSTSPFFPLYQHQKAAERLHPPHALLGDEDQSSDVRAIPPGVKGKAPARTWQRRPSEGK